MVRKIKQEKFQSACSGDLEENTTKEKYKDLVEQYKVGLNILYLLAATFLPKFRVSARKS